MFSWSETATVVALAAVVPVAGFGVGAVVALAGGIGAVVAFGAVAPADALAAAPVGVAAALALVAGGFAGLVGVVPTAFDAVVAGRVGAAPVLDAGRFAATMAVAAGSVDFGVAVGVAFVEPPQLTTVNVAPRSNGARWYLMVMGIILSFVLLAQVVVGERSDVRPLNGKFSVSWKPRTSVESQPSAVKRGRVADIVTAASSRPCGLHTLVRTINIEGQW